MTDFLVDFQGLDLQLFWNGADVLPGLLFVVEGQSRGCYLVVVLVCVVDQVMATDVEFLLLQIERLEAGGGCGDGGYGL